VVGEPSTAPPLSIVVLPLANLSNDADQEYFADSITEDLTNDLSRIPGQLVIARTTRLHLQGKVGGREANRSGSRRSLRARRQRTAA